MKDIYQLFAFGANTHAQLGTGSIDQDEPLPVLVCNSECSSEMKHPLRCVTGGANHSLIIDAVGSLWACGANSKGQLGFLSKQPIISFTRVDLEDLPALVAVAGGWAHSVALDTQGRVWTWGENKHGQLGRPQIQDHTHLPALVDLGVPTAKIACGLRHCAAVLSNGNVVTWGLNKHNQCGTDSVSTTVRLPYTVPLSLAEKCIDVACGAYHTVALLACASRLVVWGQNKFSQLGVRSTEPACVQLSPQIIDIFEEIHTDDSTILQISTGWHHTALLTKSGNVLMCGRNTHGQLADADKYDRHKLMRVDTLPHISEIACGSEHTIALCKELKATSCLLYSWGWNEHGNCGVLDSKLRDWQRGSVKVESLQLSDVVRPTLVHLSSGIGQCSSEPAETGASAILIGSGYAHAFVYVKIACSMAASLGATEIL